MAAPLPENLEDLLTYHASLKQFLNTSTAPAKVNPTRAAKARDKLLKLSHSQFFELSTDVYDELQRRIDESSDEPDFLLPRSTFHPKRNEAREKLGSLQQGRFRDLVSDILYEIERRNYNEQKTVDPPAHNSKQHVSLSSEKKQSGVVTVQSTEVIPKEADMAWSDSENEDHREFANEKADLSKVVEDVTKESFDSTDDRTSHRSKEFQSSADKYSHSKSNSIPSVISLRKRTSQQSNGSVKNDRDMVPQLNSLGSTKRSSGQINRGLSITNKNRNKDREIELLLEEGTKMDKTITELEQKSSLLQSKAEKFEGEVEDLQKINGDLHEKLTDLEQAIERKDKEIKSLHNELQISSDKLRSKEQEISLLSTQSKDLTLVPSAQDSSNNEIELERMKNEVVQLKRKLEDFKSKKISDLLSLSSDLSKPYNNYISSTGLVPLSLLIAFRDSIQNFLIHINENSKTKDVDIHETFEHISKVSNAASKIASYSHHSEKSELIRASISHAITSTRYYTVYGSMLPRLVIESAISEVVFAVYDFVSDVKLNQERVEPGENEDLKPILDEDTGETNDKLGRGFHTGVDSSFIDNASADDVSPVRPLRMTKNLNSSLNQSAEGPSSKHVESITTPKPLNLTINSQLTNHSVKPGKAPINFASDQATSNKGEKSPLSSTRLKTGSSPLVSRYSPESEKRLSTDSAGKVNTPIQMRKSSSGNILQKVKQFEQQDSSPSISKKSVINPLSDKMMNKFGKRRSSLESSSLESVGQITSSPAQVATLDVNKKNADGDLDFYADRDDVIDNIKKSAASEPDANLDEGLKSFNIRKRELKALGTSSLATDSVAIQKESQSSDSRHDIEGITGEGSLVEKEKNEELKEKKEESDVDDSKFDLEILKKHIQVNDFKNKEASEGDDAVAAATAIEEKINPDVNKKTVDKKADGFGLGSVVSGLVSATATMAAPLSRKPSIKETANSNDSSAKDIETSDGSKRPIYGLETSETKNKDLFIDKDSKQTLKDLLANPKTSDDLPNGSALTEKISTVKRAPLEVESEDDFEEEDLNKTPEIRQTNEGSKNTTPDSSDEERADVSGPKSSSKPVRKDVDEEDFDIEEFDIEDPDNTLSELLLYLEHQTVKVISTIQTLLTSIKDANSTRGDLKTGSRAINDVVSQMVDATSVSMNQSRNSQLKAHGTWVVETLSDAGKRMEILITPNGDQKNDEEYADKHFRQRLAGIAFDVAKCTKELVKTVEEANLNEEIEHLNKKLVK